MMSLNFLLILSKLLKSYKSSLKNGLKNGFNFWLNYQQFYIKAIPQRQLLWILTTTSLTERLTQSIYFPECKYPIRWYLCFCSMFNKFCGIFRWVRKEEQLPFRRVSYVYPWALWLLKCNVFLVFIYVQCCQAVRYKNM